MRVHFVIFENVPKIALAFTKGWWNFVSASRRLFEYRKSCKSSIAQAFIRLLFLLLYMDEKITNAPVNWFAPQYKA